MKKLRVAILFLVIVGMFGVVILRCPPMPTRSLAFGIRMTAPTNEALNTISIVLSNVSKYPVLFPAGFRQPWFRVAYVSNGVWAENAMRTPGGGKQLLKPHESLQSVIEVPKNAEAAKVGLRITSLTWRGELGLWLFTHCNQGILGQIQSWLSRTEQQRRSTNEWSEVLMIPVPNGS